MKGKAKTPLLSRLLSLLPTNKLEESGFDESKRSFLKSGLIVSAGLSAGLTPEWLNAATKLHPRIAIIGAGLAGLSCAWELKKAGVRASLFEADRHPGGRVKTLNNWPTEGQWVELGAEFINTDHRAILGLCKELSIPLNDRTLLRFAPHQEELVVVVNQTRYSANQLKDALKSFAPQVLQDYGLIEQSEKEFFRFDGMSLSEYLEGKEVEQWFKEVLKTAFTSEFGLEADHQTCIHLLELLGDAGEENDAVFGNSDERFSIHGGNSTLIHALSEKLNEQINYRNPLLSIVPIGNAFRLDFEGRSPEMFDWVVLAVPLSQLSKIDLKKIALPPLQREAYQEMGYGKNNKLILGFREVFWAQGQHPSIGVALHDQLNNVWHSTPFQEGNATALTAFLGGNNSLKLAETFAGIPQDSETDVMSPYLGAFEQVFPNANEHYLGRWRSALWTNNPYQQGSYACFKPGQISRYRAWLGSPVGQLFFAGEYTSDEHQGYMNGAVESGQTAAKTIMSRLKSGKANAKKLQQKR